MILTALVVVALWWAGTKGLSGKDLVTARFDALRIGLSIGVGSGGVFALYLAWRRQLSTEIGLRQKDQDQADVARAYELQRQIATETKTHQERVASAAEADAVDRRITELYTKAVEQLGSDKAPIRLGGLYALERLGQTTPGQRETIANLLCAYLRMPYVRPHPLPDDAGDTQQQMHDERIQRYDEEHEARQTALDILSRHNDSREIELCWPEMNIQLQRANLANMNLVGVALASANLSSAYLIGADLTEAILKRANLSNAHLTKANLSVANLGDADLGAANLTDAYIGDAILKGANLTDAYLNDAILTDADLTRANLSGANLTDANLSGAILSGANLMGANLMRADLADAELVGAYLGNANLSHAYLGGANLTQTDLTYTTLTRTNLTNANLTNAKVDNSALTDTIDPPNASVSE